MTEVEKMRSSQLADMSAPELQVRFEHAKKLLARMRGMSTYDEGYRELLEKLVPGIPETSIICPPFHCDHGDGIKLGEHVFVNANCTFLDGGYITIGAHTSPAVEVGHVQFLQAFILKVTLHGVKLGHGVADRCAGGKDHATVSGDLIHIAALGKHIGGFLCIRCG